MRVVILSIVAILVLFTPMHSVTATTLGSDATLTAASYQEPAQPTKEFKLDINVNRGDGGGRIWYANPVWIGGVALVLFIALIVMAASRGGSGGTTIVKE